MNTETMLKEMYEDPFFPVFLVDKIKKEIIDSSKELASASNDLEKVQEIFDSLTNTMNKIAEEFEKNGSEIETVARDSIAVAVEKLIIQFELKLDIEDALRERDW